MYECERCGEVFGEYEWKKQGQKGRFRAENPGAEARGFHLNTLASSFCGWKEVVEKPDKGQCTGLELLQRERQGGHRGQPGPPAAEKPGRLHG